MIYVYNCFRAAHLSVAAAALHLGQLSPDAAVGEVLALEYFDVMTDKDMGVPVCLGRDENGSAVYILGLGRGGQVFARLVDSVAGELGVAVDCKLVDCRGEINLLIRLGGFLSRFWRWRRLGRRLAALGISSRLKSIHRLVLQARGGAV